MMASKIGGVLCEIKYMASETSITFSLTSK